MRDLYRYLGQTHRRGWRDFLGVDRVHCMDALSMLKLLPDDSIDMGLTSPPYDNLRTYNGFTWDFEGIAQQLYRAIKPGGVLVWIVGDATIDGSETLTSFKQAIYFKDQCGFKVHDTMIYSSEPSPQNPAVRYSASFQYMFILSKGKPLTYNLTRMSEKTGEIKLCTKRSAKGDLVKKTWRPGGSPLSNVWHISTGGGKMSTDPITYQHPAVFPEILAERHIRTWSNPGNVVLDPFMGSGTTAKMAWKHGRHYIGCDISPEYVTLSRQRLATTDPYQHTPISDTETQLSLFASPSENG